MTIVDITKQFRVLPDQSQDILLKIVIVLSNVQTRLVRLLEDAHSNLLLSHRTVRCQTSVDKVSSQTMTIRQAIGVSKKILDSSSRPSGYDGNTGDWCCYFDVPSSASAKGFQVQFAKSQEFSNV